MTAYMTFFIPRCAAEVELEELNRFLKSHRILRTEHVYENGGWSFLVEYADRSAGGANGSAARVDYREILTPEEFATFAKLRDVRKTLAEREGMAAFAIATNDQLAQMVRLETKSVAMLREISGFGASRAEKYGEDFVRVLKQGDRKEEVKKEREELAK